VPGGARYVGCWPGKTLPGRSLINQLYAATEIHGCCPSPSGSSCGAAFDVHLPHASWVILLDIHYLFDLQLVTADHQGCIIFKPACTFKNVGSQPVGRTVLRLTPKEQQAWARLAVPALTKALPDYAQHKKIYNKHISSAAVDTGDACVLHWSCAVSSITNSHGSCMHVPQLHFPCCLSDRSGPFFVHVQLVKWLNCTKTCAANCA